MEILPIIIVLAALIFGINLYLNSIKGSFGRIFRSAADEIGFEIIRDNEDDPEFDNELDNNFKETLILRGKKSNIDVNIKGHFGGKVGSSKTILRFKYKSKETLQFRIEYRNDTVDIADYDNVESLVNTGDYDFDEKFMFNISENMHLPAYFDTSIRFRLSRIVDSCQFMIIDNHMIYLVLFAFDFKNGIEFAGYIDEMISISEKICSLEKTFLTLKNNIEKEKQLGAKIKMIEALAEYPDKQNEIEKICKNEVDKYFDDYKNSKEDKYKSFKYDFYTSIKIACAKVTGEKGEKQLLDILYDNVAPEHKIEVIRFLAKDRFNKHKSDLTRLYTNSKDWNVKKQLLNSFIEKKDPALNGEICDELDSGMILDEAQTELLGMCGTKESVEALCKLEEKLINPKYKKMCRDAINRIQSRSGSGEKGWVSVADNNELSGALSENDSLQKGSLSKEND